MKLNDSQIYFNPFTSSCINCKHFKNYIFECDAFKDEIPEEILSGENKHLKPLPNQDNDIVFEPIK